VTFEAISVSGEKKRNQTVVDEGIVTSSPQASVRPLTARSCASPPSTHAGRSRAEHHDPQTAIDRPKNVPDGLQNRYPARG
jgi:hypothetical protein